MRQQIERVRISRLRPPYHALRCPLDQRTAAVRGAHQQLRALLHRLALIHVMKVPPRRLRHIRRFLRVPAPEFVRFARGCLRRVHDENLVATSEDDLIGMSWEGKRELQGGEEREGRSHGIMASRRISTDPDTRP